MAFIYLCHASEDKPLLKALVTFLARDGFRMFIDRPGTGDSHFGFLQHEIEAYGIRGLPAGLAYDDELRTALNDAGLVLGCISQHVRRDRVIIDNELVFASLSGRLVTCLIDDTPYEALDSFGLVRLPSVQMKRIDCAALSSAEELVATNVPRGDWPSAPREAFQVAEELAAEIRRRLEELGTPVPLPEPQRRKVIAEIGAVPIWPPLAAHELTFDVIAAFMSAFLQPAAAVNHLNTAMDLLWQSSDGEYTRQQLLVSPAALPAFAAVGAENFWTDTFLSANQKARRTVAALVLTPGPHRPAGTLEFVDTAVAEFATLFEKGAGDLQQD